MSRNCYPHVFQVVDAMAYFALSVLGFYFIFQGDVLEKFASKRTNFAQYEEEVTELPTILTYIDMPDGQVWPHLICPS